MLSESQRDAGLGAELGVAVKREGGRREWCCPFCGGVEDDDAMWVVGDLELHMKGRDGCPHLAMAANVAAENSTRAQLFLFLSN